MDSGPAPKKAHPGMTMGREFVLTAPDPTLRQAPASGYHSPTGRRNGYPSAGMTTRELCPAHDVLLRSPIIGSSAAADFCAQRGAGLSPRPSRGGAFGHP